LTLTTGEIIYPREMSGATFVKVYRCYILNDDDRFVAVYTQECVDDEAAIQWGGGFLRKESPPAGIEIWDRDRQVHRVHRRVTPPRS
jgi:hypothetical protein